MLRRKYLAKKNVHKGGSIDTASANTGNFNVLKRLKSRKTVNVAKLMPEFGAEKQVEDKRLSALKCHEERRCENGVLVDIPDATCVGSCNSRRTGVTITKDLHTRTSSEHLAYKKSRLRLIEKPANIHSC